MKNKKQIYEGYIINQWKVLQANVINPQSNDIRLINRPVFSKCICISCNKTIRYISNTPLRTGKRLSQKCKSCTLIQHNIKNRKIKIGDKYGHLTIVGDAGYEQQTKGHNRHYSWCICDCGNINKIKIMDNKILTGNTTSCGCLSSKGEDAIKQLLNQNHINYDYDKCFEPLFKETKRRLRFDFIIYNNQGQIDRFVEFDGNQHKTGMWGGNWSNIEDYDTIHERDMIKNKFCIQHNYKLIRIPYSALSTLSISDIMEDKYAL